MTSRISRHRVLTVGLAVAALTTFSAVPALADGAAGDHGPGPSRLTIAVEGLHIPSLLGFGHGGAPYEGPHGDHGDHGGRPSEPTVVAQGLHNPRQLSFGRYGDLYVAEAGSGGTSPCMEGPEGDTVCFGTTGSVTKVSLSGGQTRVLTGLPSLANQGDGSQALGASDVASHGQKMAVLIGLGGNLDLRASLPSAGAIMGTLQLADTESGHMSTIADLAAYEAKANPIDDVDSDPVGLAVGMGRFVVADAGGNDVVSVQRDGQVTTVAAFPDRMVDAPASLGLPAGTKLPMQAVPTSAVRGPDGAWYVSELTGFPFPVGAANIYRIGHDGDVSVYASGLTNVTDLAFQGSTLYAVEIASAGLLAGPTGALVRVDEGSTAPTTVLGDLFAPYGLAIRGGMAYVTTGSVSADAGQVMRIPLF